MIGNEGDVIILNGTRLTVIQMYVCMYVYDVVRMDVRTRVTLPPAYSN